jgi:hypothetical protein
MDDDCNEQQRDGYGEHQNDVHSRISFLFRRPEKGCLGLGLENRGVGTSGDLCHSSHHEGTTFLCGSLLTAADPLWSFQGESRGLVVIFTLATLQRSSSAYLVAAVASRRRDSRPEVGDWETHKPVPKLHPPVARVHHHANHEVGAHPIELVAQASHRGCVLAPGSRRCFHLDRHHAPICRLKDRVDLESLSIAEVVQPSRRPRPRELLCDLGDHKRLDQRANRRIVSLGQRFGTLTDDGCSESGVACAVLAAR